MGAIALIGESMEKGCAWCRWAMSAEPCGGHLPPPAPFDPGLQNIFETESGPGVRRVEAAGHRRHVAPLLPIGRAKLAKAMPSPKLQLLLFSWRPASRNTRQMFRGSRRAGPKNWKANGSNRSPGCWLALPWELTASRCWPRRWDAASTWLPRCTWLNRLAQMGGGSGQPSGALQDGKANLAATAGSDALARVHRGKALSMPWSGSGRGRRRPARTWPCSAWE